MSKNKGNAGEREVCALLKPWWAAHEPTAPNGKPIHFVRVPLSGGWVYGDSFDACGDIMTNASSFPFSVEVKRVERWKLAVLLEGKPSPIWGFWRQCQRDAKKMETEPMLWFRQNRQPWFVMLRKRYALKVEGIARPDVLFSDQLRLQVDCEEVPVMYLGKKFLSHSPQIFAN